MSSAALLLTDGTDGTGGHVQISGISRVFPAVAGTVPIHALGPIDLTIERGEFFAIVGPSGCGKSTLLEILAGLQQASNGVVYFEGRNVSGRVPQGVGIVFQEDSCLPWLSVADNVAFGLKHAGGARSEITEQVMDALAFTGLQEFATAYPAQLSGGMRQRVCIARTLVMKPRLILLDEPFGALDHQTRLAMGDELLRLWRQTSATVLLITHALDEAAMLSDRVGVMSARPGRLIDVITTRWPRERDSRIISDPSFAQVTARMWNQLRRESLRAIGSATDHP